MESSSPVPCREPCTPGSQPVPGHTGAAADLAHLSPVKSRRHQFLAAVVRSPFTKGGLSAASGYLAAPTTSRASSTGGEQPAGVGALCGGPAPFTPASRSNMKPGCEAAPSVPSPVAPSKIRPRSRWMAALFSSGAPKARRAVGGSRGGGAVSMAGCGAAPASAVAPHLERADTIDSVGSSLQLSRQNTKDSLGSSISALSHTCRRLFGADFSTPIEPRR